MRKLFIVLGIVVMLFAITSCTSHNADEFDLIFPLGILEYENIGFDYLIQIYKSNNFTSIYLYSFTEVISCDFKLNGSDIEINWYYNDQQSYWMSVINPDMLGNINFDAGETISYYLEINNKFYEGELEMLSELGVNWNEFDFNEDFEFDWNIDEEPDIYNVRILFWYTLNNESDLIEKVWEIEGDRSEFSISKNVYNDYLESSWYHFSARLHAINFVNHNKCLAWTATDAYSDPEVNEYNKSVNPDKKMKEIMNMFMNQHH